MSIELVIASLMAIVAILVGFAGPAPHSEPQASLEAGPGTAAHEAAHGEG